MIKVNLLGSKTGASAQAYTSVGDDQEAAKKLVTMLVFSLILYAYEFYNIGNLEDEYKKISNQAKKISAQVTSRESLSKEAQAMQKEIQEIEDKIKAIKELSKIRLRELKAFDTIQNIIPEKLWIKTMRYSEQKLELTGFALDDADLTIFLKALQDRPYFSKVILKKATDAPGENGVVKEYLITCNVEVGE